MTGDFPCPQADVGSIIESEVIARLAERGPCRLRLDVGRPSERDRTEVVAPAAVMSIEIAGISISA
jgi:hypothetical protein